MNKRLINEWGAGMPKSNPYKEPKRPSKPLTPKKPNNPWAKSEEPEEDIPVGKREKRFDPNNWKNESRNMNKKLIRLTEGDLHRIVKESVQRILAENGETEAWNNGQLANLAGQANGARSTLGGKIKGFFNPKWKARKKRQEKLFADTAAGNRYDYSNSLTNDNTMGNFDTDLRLPGNNYTYDTGGNSDWMRNQFNPKGEIDKENPFKMRRYQSYETPKYSSDGRTIGHTSTPGVDNGRIYNRNEFGDEFITPETSPSKQSAAINFKAGNSSLNNAYRQGRNAAMGKNMVNSKGEDFGGTGTKNGAFRRLGKEYR